MRDDISPIVSAFSRLPLSVEPQYPAVRGPTTMNVPLSAPERQSGWVLGAAPCQNSGPTLETRYHQNADQPRGERRREMLRARGTRTGSESTLLVAGLWGYPMFPAGVDAYSNAGLDGLDCQEGSGRLSRFKAAGSLLGQSLDPCTELLDPVAPLGL